MTPAVVGIARWGVSDSQTHAEQRRIASINVVALVALAITGTYTVLLSITLVLNGGFLTDGMLVFFVSVSALIIAGYVATIAMNRRGQHNAAVALVLTTGVVNLVAATIVMGFSSGPAVFLVVIAMAAVLLTTRDAHAMRWFFVLLPAGAFVALMVLDPPAPEHVEGTAIQSMILAANFVGMVLFVVAVALYQRHLADDAEDALAEAHKESEDLLLNILPADIAQRLKDGESPIADEIPNATVLFADIVGFTKIADQLPAEDVVSTLDGLFSAFDDIAAAFGMEKIKTVGDNYFAVSGLTDEAEAAFTAANATLAMRDEATRHAFPGAGPVRMRFGLHTGPAVAGVIGKRKFSFDIWGDTVNTASRMESTGEPQRIQVSHSTHEALRGAYHLRSLGEVEAKGKGSLRTYELIGRLDEQALSARATE